MTKMAHTVITNYPHHLCRLNNNLVLFILD